MTEQALPKICVILGAGASYDVRNEGFSFLNRGLQPPFAQQLFDLEQRGEFRSIIGDYEGAVVLAQELASRSRSSDFNLEKELRILSEHTSQLVKNHYKHIPPYLRDLLLVCSYEYTSYPSCYVRLVKTLMADEPSEVLFLVLNYDDLLEQALYRFTEGALRFESLDDYVRPGRSVKVVKLHGSINWFKPIGAASVNWKAMVKESDVLAKSPDSEVRVATKLGKSDQRRTHEMVLDRQRVYPVLTAPLAGKGATAAVCPEAHLLTAREFIVDCERFLIIGASGQDDDLLALLHESAKTRRPLVNFVSGNEGEGQKVWQRFVERVGEFGSVTTRAGQLAFDGGFQAYVASNELIKFLQTSL